MSEFITTMAARAAGEITKVEPLISSMFLSLPPMPGDYAEDMFAEPEPPESLEDDPDLSFLPLLNYDPWSVEIPNWYENEDFEVEETKGENSPESLHRERTNQVESSQNLPEKLVNKNTSDSNLNTETKIIKSEVILREENREWQSKEEASNYSATPQGNSLDTESVSVEANGELNPLVSKTKSELPQVSNDDQLNISRKSTYLENQEIPSFSTEDTQSTITPQVNRLQAASPPAQANLDSNPPISNTESELTKVSDDNPLDISQELTNLEHRETNTFSSDETQSTITPQVNRLGVESSSLQANIESNPSISNTKSELTTASDENQVQANQQLTNLDNRENLTSSTEEIFTTITPQVNRLEKTSPSLQANIESNTSISNTQSELTRASNENKGKANEQLTNLDNRENLTSSTEETSTTITPQVNRLETASPSLQANINSNPSISNTQSNSTTGSDNNQLIINRKVAGLENSEIKSSAKPKVNQLNSADSNADLSNISGDNLLNITKSLTNLEHQETNTSSSEDTSPNITPAINSLELASPSLQAKTGENSSIDNTEFNPIPISDDSQVNKQNNLKQSHQIPNANQVKANSQLNNLVNEDTDTFSEKDKLSKIAPQINRLEATSISAQASLDSHSSIPNTESELNEVSEYHSLQISKEFTDLDNGEVRKSSQDDTSPTITPQVNRLETTSPSLQANLESNPSILNTELGSNKVSDDNQANTSSKVTGSENGEINPSTITDTISSAITPQINRLEKASQSVKANVESHPSIANQDYDLIQSSDNHQEKVNQILTNPENRQAYKSSQEDKTALTVTPQVNQLNEKSRLVQANVESNPSILNTESELAQKSDNHQAITSTKGTELDNREIPISSTNETSSGITPQINRLEKASQSVKANVESHPSIANHDYDLIQKFDESQAKVNQKSTNIENRKAYEHDRENKTSTEVQVQSNVPTSTTNSSPLEQKKLTENSDTRKQNNSSINKTSSTVVSQVSRAAEKISKSTNVKVSKANTESSQNEQVNKISKQQKVNPSYDSPSESNLVSNNRNYSLIYPLRQLGNFINRSNHKQKPKQSDLTRKKIGEKTVTPNLQNNSAPLVTSQESPNIKEQKLSHINQIRPGKESVKPELTSDASYSLPNTTSSDNGKSKNNAQQSNSPKIQRSPLNSSHIPQSSQSNQLKNREGNRPKLPQQRITPQQTVEARIQQPANILSDLTSKNLNGERYTKADAARSGFASRLRRSLHDTKKLQSPVSKASQSSNYSQQNSVLSNPHDANLNLNPVKNTHNTQYIPNYISKNESKLNSNYSSIKPNINENITVITNQEISTNLSPPKEKKLSPVNNQTESRQKQSESRSSPTIQITIGRIEVRGNQPPPSPKSTTRKSTKKTPSLSLQDYLKQRDGNYKGTDGLF